MRDPWCSVLKVQDQRKLKRFVQTDWRQCIISFSASLTETRSTPTLIYQPFKFQWVFTNYKWHTHTQQTSTWWNSGVQIREQKAISTVSAIVQIQHLDLIIMKILKSAVNEAVLCFTCTECHQLFALIYSSVLRFNEKHTRRDNHVIGWRNQSINVMFLIPCFTLIKKIFCSSFNEPLRKSCRLRHL